MSSESPKWIALALSLIALTISSLSWWEAHQVKLMNEEINQAIFEAEDLRITSYATKDQIVANFNIPLKNIGKFTAMVHLIDMQPRLVNPAKNCAVQPPNNLTVFTGVEILPGTNGTISRVFILSPGCEKQEFTADLRAWYVDVINQRPRSRPRRQDAG